MRRTWRASKGLLRGEDAASDELLLVCKGEEGGTGAAAGAAALAATGATAVATAAWEGEEQEISNLQESTALIPVVRSSILTLIELRGWHSVLGQFFGFSSFTHTMLYSPRERRLHIYRQPGQAAKRC